MNDLLSLWLCSLEDFLAMDPLLSSLRTGVYAPLVGAPPPFVIVFGPDFCESFVTQCSVSFRVCIEAEQALIRVDIVMSL